MAITSTPAPGSTPVYAPDVAPAAVDPAPTTLPVTDSATLVAPVLTVSPDTNDINAVYGVITNLTIGATYTMSRTSVTGLPAISSPLYQSTTFTAASLPVGITYTFTTTALMSDGTSATSAPVTISL